VRLWNLPVCPLCTGASADYLATLRHRPTRMAALASLLASTRAYSELAGPLDPAALVLSLGQGRLCHHGYAGLALVPEEELGAAVLAAAREVRGAAGGSRAFDAVQVRACG
jgi:hypothetical protein